MFYTHLACRARAKPARASDAAGCREAAVPKRRRREGMSRQANPKRSGGSGALRAPLPQPPKNHRKIKAHYIYSAKYRLLAEFDGEISVE
jgi:hypothetical protein